MTHYLILVVDEDANLSRSFALILQRAGYFVTNTATAHEGLDQIRSGKFHLVILNSKMPETSRVLLPEALVFYPYLSIVVLTDRPLSEAESKKKLLSVQYLVQPVEPERLLDCVRTMLGLENSFFKNEKFVNSQ